MMGIVTLTPFRGGPTFSVDVGDWQDSYAFGERREWIERLSLFVIYKYGRVLSATGTKERPYPPVITYEVPNDKIKILSALRFLRSEDKDAVSKLFDKDLESFEREVLARGIARALGGRGK